MMSKFREVFSTDLHGMPPDRNMDFCIDLEPGTCPITIPPYCMDSSKLREVKEPGTRPISIPPYCMDSSNLRDVKAQIQELLDKCFIRPIVSLWGDPIYLLRKITVV